MKTFDEILPVINEVLADHTDNLAKIGKLIINRDLNGIIRFVVDEKLEAKAEAKKAIDSIIKSLMLHLESRIADKNTVIYESSLDDVIKGTSHFSLKDFQNVIIIDRLLAESDWTHITEKAATHRIVFYSIKGGVGRSTALATTAWALAEQGKKVMVLDLDLESPGISTSLLSEEKCPTYGITDWLVEDLVDNGAEVLPYMVGLSDISHNGTIYVIPAHGKEAGEYIAKLGRAWMSKRRPENFRELWQTRLNQLLGELEKSYNPDIVLIDSRAGIDEVSSACITSLGAEIILLFAIDSEQTWRGYDILFQHWLRNNTVKEIRERLQLVAALIPETKQQEYVDGLCEHAWDLFTSKLYDTIPPGNSDMEYFNYDKSDSEAPHYPWRVMWNRAFAVLPNLYEPLQQSVIIEQIQGIFGQLINQIKEIISND
jgi:MinD-like ATPase involved in chromosome partitioning or flagellar assembly